MMKLGHLGQKLKQMLRLVATTRLTNKVQGTRLGPNDILMTWQL